MEETRPEPFASPVASDATQRAREEAASWLILLDDDPDNAAERARFHTWLDASSANAAAWASINRTSGLLASMAEPASRPATVRRRFAARRYAGAVAAVALAASVVLVLAPTLTLRWRADYLTGTGQIDTVRLADGTSVRLGPDSAIRVAFADGERHVALLSGEALFEVQHDAARPFAVTAGNATITDLGTRFDVALLGDGIAVTVARGAVRVSTAAGTTLDLHPGDWARLDSADPPETGAGLPDDLTTGPAERIAARNRPVSEVIDRLRPWFSGRIVLADAGVGQRLVTGVFDATDPARALEALVGPQGGRVIQVTPWLLIVAGR